MVKSYFFGAFCEVIWVIGMKHSITWWEIFRDSNRNLYQFFYALIKAGEELPVGTAYAVFVGLGSAGTIVTDHFFIPHTFGYRKSSFFLLLLLIGVIGLKKW